MLDNMWRYYLVIIMASVRKTCLFLVLFGIGHTRGEERACSNSKIYYPGDNVTVSINAVQKDKYNMSEIYFCSFTSKLHFTNVMLYNTTKSPADNRDVNRNYTGRITNMKMTNGSLSFLLLNVTFTDSGNFTDSRNSCEKAKSTILVTRRRLTAYVHETFILDFMCQNTNTSLVIINTMGRIDSKTLAIYNMTQKNCTYVMDNNLSRVKNCEFKEGTLRLTFSSLTWLNKGTYIAWDDTYLLLDSIFMNIQEKGESTSSSPLGYNVHYESNELSSTERPHGYRYFNINIASSDVEHEQMFPMGPEDGNGVRIDTEVWVRLLFAEVGVAVTVPLTVASTLLILWRMGYFQFTCMGPESNELSSTERPNGYFNPSFVTNTASSDAENEVWVRLLFAAVGVAVTVPLTVASTLLILWKRGSFQFTCMGPESNELSSTERPHGYFNSSFVTTTAGSDAENEVWVRLFFAAVGVAVTVPLTVASTLLILWKRGSFQFTCMGPESSELSSTERPHGYFNSSFVTTTAGSDAENEVWVRLLFAAVGVAVTVPLTVASTLLILWRRGSFQFTCMGPDQALNMGPISKKNTKSAAADESEYEEPRSNTTDLSIYLEPIGIETVHREDNNPSGSCINEYEKLHPYGNQGNNTYSSLGEEHIIQNK